MIAVDTNLLVYAHREDSPWHAKALVIITELADSGAT
jgi:predicted nucleic acid-binding protein